MDVPRLTGRRPGKPDTRAQVLAAARTVFVEEGFDGATIRGIARRAQVDPALVHRWYGDKRSLFLAAVRLDFDPDRVLQHLQAGGADHLGPRLALAALSGWESPIAQAWLEMVRANPALLPSMVGFLNEPMTRASRVLLGLSDREGRLRAGVVEAVMVGFLGARYIARLEPLASLPPPDAARLMGPLLDHALIGDLGVAPPG